MSKPKAESKSDPFPNVEELEARIFLTAQRRKHETVQSSIRALRQYLRPEQHANTQRSALVEVQG